MYSNADGDMPTALSTHVLVPCSTASSTDSFGVPFIVFLYNVRSLDASHRLDLLINELRDKPWDLIVIVETWREHSEELWKTSEGHMFCGAGGCKGKRGVAFLLHKRWGFDSLIEDSFARATERIATLDLEVHGKRIRVVAAYLPHSGYSDSFVQDTYDIVEHLVHEGRRKGLSILLAGDFNAEVGTNDQDIDDFAVIGENGIHRRNDRGRWLLNWCSILGLCISNTHFTNIFDETWTYVNGGICRQLDFVIVDVALFKAISMCKATSAVDIGSDHRPVSMCLHIRKLHKRQKKGFQGASKWEVCKPKYQEVLNHKLEDYPFDAEDLSDKAIFLERAMLDAGKAASTNVGDHASLVDSKQTEIRKLIDERRALDSNSTLDWASRRQKRTEICKRIQKLVRLRLKERKRERIGTILHEFRDLKSIASIKRAGRKDLITRVMDDDGNTVTSRKGIAEVFADFYETLYTGTGEHIAEHVLGIDELGDDEMAFSMAELEQALKLLKRGKAKDCAGIFCDMMKDGCGLLNELLLDLFNEVLKPGREPPASWRESVLVVLFKKGDPALPKNYRPIAILPAIYKLFSRMLCSRITEKIMSNQSVDQAAYRKGFSTEDHLLSAALLIEGSAEFNEELWLALVDFEKAFDSVNHDALWSVLEKQGVHSKYVSVLRKLYYGQTARVRTDVDSRSFSMTRGVKQGDPISALLFIAVMEQCLQELKQRWKHLNSRRMRTGYGIVIDDPQDPLLNLRFADDVILIARSQQDIAKMIRDLGVTAAKYGLKLHKGKTKVMTNNAAAQGQQIDVDGSAVDIVDENGAEKYLGRKLSVNNLRQAELKHRIACGWGAFAQYRTELCGKHYSFADKARLFDCVVTPRVLYGTAAWTMTHQMCHELRVARRKMLRMMFGAHRRQIDRNIAAPTEDAHDSGSDTEHEAEIPAAEDTAVAGTDHPMLEPWPDFIRRVTHRMEESLHKLGMEDWVVLHWQRKWNLATNVLRKSDKRWTSRLIKWRMHDRPGRLQGVPVTRWTDDFCNLAGGDWPQLAIESDLWDLLEHPFTHREEIQERVGNRCG